MKKDFVVYSITASAFVEIACNLTARLCFVSSSTEALFVFEDIPEVRSAVEEFYRGGQICAREYSKHIGDLRRKCRDARTGAALDRHSRELGASN
jgi:hypothetical protein